MNTPIRREYDVLPCMTTDPEVFHDDATVGLAKSLCLSCSLWDLCRSQARERREWGTWGAETAAERAAAGYAPRGWRWDRPQQQSGKRKRTRKTPAGKKRG
ncbi:WhiB family transcriptional regulator [Streptomyces nanshensis]|uniref:WhiB family transcriptional regulator n=1 Tax=Streptomyces nanshensis TaxID=518642 RepID=UPI00085BF569|nr:WhiB family transcriptional regulator [Streptomyces nanshensis]